MKFPSSTLLLSLLSTLAAAQTPNPSGGNAFNIPPQGYLLNAGQSTTFTWSNLQGSTVTLTLRSGANGNLNQGEAIASNIQNSGSYTWAVPSDIVQGNSYTIEISDDQDSSVANFTPQFDILSNVLASSAAPSSATPTSAAASSSSAPATSTSAPATSTSSPATTATSASASSASAQSTLSTSVSAGSSSGSATSGTTATSTGAAPSSTTSSGSARGVAVGAGAGLFAVAAGFAGLF